MKTQAIKTQAIIAACVAFAAPFAAASGAAGAALPAGVAAGIATATEVAALPDGGWLALDKSGLRLLDASGAERARHPVRGKQLDTRSLPGGVLATLVDSNTERTVAIDADLKAGALRVLAPFPAPSFAPEAACLYRDAQQLSYQFLVAKDGQGEQWLLDGENHKLVRKLALPTHVRHCRVDDATGTLFVSESGMGLWAYSADAEGAASVGERHALALRPPYGKLPGGAGALALLPGGVAMLDAKGKSLNLFSRRDGAWQAQAPRTLKAAVNLSLIHI